LYEAKQPLSLRPTGAVSSFHRNYNIHAKITLRSSPFEVEVVFEKEEAASDFFGKGIFDAPATFSNCHLRLIDPQDNRASRVDMTVWD